MKVLAKVVDYGIVMTKDGTAPMVKIQFKETETGKDRYWTGSLKEGRAQEITVDALLVCDLKSDEIEKLALGTASGLLNTDKEVQLTIENEEYEGKTYEKVKWVNEVGGGGFAKRISESDAVARIAACNVGFTLKAKRQEKGQPVVKQDSEIPF